MTDQEEDELQICINRYSKFWYTSGDGSGRKERWGQKPKLLSPLSVDGGLARLAITGPMYSNAWESMKLTG